MHMVAQTKPRNARRDWRSLLWDERASSVAQAAAVAILATALLGAMLLVVPSLGSAVDRSFSCLVSVLGGSGAGCSGGAAAQATAAQDAAANAPEPPSSDDGGGGFWGGLLDGVQIGLDVVGLVPGVGEIADGLNGLISLARGDYTGAALSFGAMIPFAGWGATGAKWVRTGVRLSDEAGGLARYGDEAAQYGDEAATAGRNTDEMAPVCTSSAPRGKAPGLAAPMAAGCDLPGSPAHREQRWQEYLERKRAEGQEPWSRERWDQQYDINLQQARRANQRVDAYRDEIGWGEREVTVDLGDGTVRRLDIADVSRQRGIEHKTGYTTRSPEIDSEVLRDAELVRRGWDIEWVFEGTPSRPLLELLEEHGITYVIR